MIRFFAHRPQFVSILLIFAAVVAAYSNSFSGQFFFDDFLAITDNPTIRHLSTAFLPPPGGFTVSGRPFLNFTFALNYAVGGKAVFGYHVVNLLIHLLAALTLFGIVRRTLENTGFVRNGLTVATMTALFWALNPLQTEAVTYVVQRAESLGALFCLLTLYYFIRRNWIASVLACALGMMTKETMATAPVIIFLYDWIFLTRSEGLSLLQTLHRRPRYYGCLTATWMIFTISLLLSGNRVSSGFGIDITPWCYALTQTKALATYLGLIVWPHPLLFDYGRGFFISHFQEAFPYLPLMLALYTATIVGVVRRSPFGFLGAWFLLILAPTSTFIPVRDAIWDHRLYLSLAAPMLLLALGLQAVAGRRAWIVATILCMAYGTVTWNRNEIYHDNLTFWQLNLKQNPTNSRVYVNIAANLLDQNHPAEAIPYLRESIRLYSKYPESHNDLGDALFLQGDYAGALVEYRESLRLAPCFYFAMCNFANALFRQGRLDHAERVYLRALELKSDDPVAHLGLGNLFWKEGHSKAALAQFQETLRIDPGNAEATEALEKLGRVLN